MGKHACETGNTPSKFAIECVFLKKYFENKYVFSRNMPDLQS